MDFEIRHRFPCPPSAYWALISTPAYEAELQKTASVEISVLERVLQGSRRRERLKVVSKKALPAIAQQAMGVERFSYVQENESDDDKLQTSWKVKPDVGGDRVKCQGTTRVVATADGCERIIQGQIEIAVPFLGKKMEQSVIDDLKGSYDRAADAARALLARGSA